MKLDKSKVDIPMEINYLNVALFFNFAILFIPPLSAGHYVSIVYRHGVYYLMDDTKVTKLRDRSVPGALKRNKYGYFYGVCYTKK